MKGDGFFDNGAQWNSSVPADFFRGGWKIDFFRGGWKIVLQMEGGESYRVLAVVSFGATVVWSSTDDDGSGKNGDIEREWL